MAEKEEEEAEPLLASRVPPVTASAPTAASDAIPPSPPSSSLRELLCSGMARDDVPSGEPGSTGGQQAGGFVFLEFVGDGDDEYVARPVQSSLLRSLADAPHPIAVHAGSEKSEEEKRPPAAAAGSEVRGDGEARGDGDTLRHRASSSSSSGSKLLNFLWSSSLPGSHASSPTKKKRSMSLSLSSSSSADAGGAAGQRADVPDASGALDSEEQRLRLEEEAEQVANEGHVASASAPTLRPRRSMSLSSSMFLRTRLSGLTLASSSSSSSSSSSFSSTSPGPCKRASVQGASGKIATGGTPSGASSPSQLFFSSLSSFYLSKVERAVPATRSECNRIALDFFDKLDPQGRRWLKLMHAYSEKRLASQVGVTPAACEDSAVSALRAYLYEEDAKQDDAEHDREHEHTEEEAKRQGEKGQQQQRQQQQEGRTKRRRGQEDSSDSDEDAESVLSLTEDDSTSAASSVGLTLTQHSLAAEIDRDVPRTYPTLAHLQGPGARRALSLCLHAVAEAYPEVGYVQGMNYIMAHLLVHFPGAPHSGAPHSGAPHSGGAPPIRNGSPRAGASPKGSEAKGGPSGGGALESPDAASALSAFRFLMEDPAFRLYDLFSPGLAALKRCVGALRSLVKHHARALFERLKALGMDGMDFSYNWFLTCFAYSMPFESLAQVWDLFFQTGWEAIFKVGLVLVTNVQREVLGGDFEAATQALRSAPVFPPRKLLARAKALKLTPSDRAQIANIFRS